MGWTTREGGKEGGRKMSCAYDGRLTCVDLGCWEGYILAVSSWV